MIEIISATRLSEVNFWNESALGQSLQRLASYDQRFTSSITFENSTGLPNIYNAYIKEETSSDILCFIHDDVWIDDYFFIDRTLEGLEIYDIIGVAGNRRRLKNQPSWAFIDTKFTWDDQANLSGRVAHGFWPFGDVSYFGPVPADCELLDGVFLAVKKSVLLVNQVKFDSQFDFHFYDMDFCRTARSKGLKLGTWPICLTHQSVGNAGEVSWQNNYHLYLEKWNS